MAATPIDCSGLNRLAAKVAPMLGTQRRANPMQRIDVSRLTDTAITLANKTSDLSGDGAALTITLADALCHGVVEALARGVEGSALKAGIDKGVEAACSAIKAMAQPVTNKKTVIRLALRNAAPPSDMQALVVEALDWSGDSFAHDIVRGANSEIGETHIRSVAQYVFDRGYLSPIFVNNSGPMCADFDQAALLVLDGKISRRADVLVVIDLARTIARPLLIVADVEAGALAALAVAVLAEHLPLCAVKPPGFGDNRKAQLSDIAAFSEAKVVSEVSSGLSRAVIGRAEKVSVSADRTHIIGRPGNGDALARRLDEIVAQIRGTESDFEQNASSERLLKLSDSIAVLHVDPKDEMLIPGTIRAIADSIHVARAIKEEGIVPGSGTAFVRAAKALDSCEVPEAARPGISIVQEALMAPFRTLATNAAMDQATVLAVIEGRSGYGIDVASRKIVDLVAADIIDAAKVLQLALRHASLVADLFLASGAVP